MKLATLGAVAYARIRQERNCAEAFARRCPSYRDQRKQLTRLRILESKAVARKLGGKLGGNHGERSR